MAVDAHLLHTVPVNQCIWVSEVSGIVLVISHHKLAIGLQEKLLVEGLVRMAPLVPAAPAGLANISDATIGPTGFKGEVEQVVQTYLFGSSKLSRAKLSPARLGYLLTSSSACNPILPSSSLGGSLVKILVFL
jgi:hypothetical protein